MVGPKLERIWWSDVRFLSRHVADQNQYLVVSYHSGAKEHVRGPASLFEDPVIHKKVEVKAALSLNAFEAVVVYTEADEAELAAGGGRAANAREKGLAASGSGSAAELDQPPTAMALPTDGKKVTRRIIRGPTLFIPAANEWVHSFSWHGSNNQMDDRRTMIKDALKLTKIRTLPDQLYYNVVGCRTSDDAQLQVKLMMFFQMTDLEKMLDSTHDPIGDFVNAMSADVIRFVSDHTFEEFIAKGSELNELAAFPLLEERSRSIGYKVDRVVFRGYTASEQLQRMHDTAIKSRTSLQLEAKTAEQQQSIEDLKLRRRLERGAQEREMEGAMREHALGLAKLEHEEKLRQGEAEAAARNGERAADDSQRLAFLTGLAEKGVDLTKFLCAVERGKNERVISFEGGGGGVSGSAVPHLHLGSVSE